MFWVAFKRLSSEKERWKCIQLHNCSTIKILHMWNNYILKYFMSVIILIGKTEKLFSWWLCCYFSLTIDSPPLLCRIYSNSPGFFSQHSYETCQQYYQTTFITIDFSAIHGPLGSALVYYSYSTLPAAFLDDDRACFSHVWERKVAITQWKLPPNQRQLHGFDCIQSELCLQSGNYVHWWWLDYLKIYI